MVEVVIVAIVSVLVGGAVGWLLEELRVSLFAQQLGTRFPVSDKRIRKAMAQL